MDKIEILNGNPLYQSSPEGLRDEMREFAVAATLETGAFFVHEGDRPIYLAMVGAGRLRVYKTGQTGREITLYHVGPREICLLNMITLLSEMPSPASAMVQESLQAVLLPADRFRGWMSTQTSVRSFVFSSLSNQLVEMMSLIEEISFTSMDCRLAGFLANAATPDDHGSHFILMTHDQIARELGTVREVVSRLLKKLERDGLVELSRSCIRIVDLKSLAILD